VPSPARGSSTPRHWIESALDIAAIAYDVYDISQNGLNWENGLALAADVVSLALPVVAGGGMVVRGIAHADDAVDAIRGVETAGEAVETTSDIVKAVDAGCSFTANTPVESANGLTAIGDCVTPISCIASCGFSPRAGVIRLPELRCKKSPTPARSSAWLLRGLSRRSPTTSPPGP
jgi:hypothetical protein